MSTPASSRVSRCSLHRRRRGAPALVAALVLLLPLSACGGSEGGSSSPRTLRVFAAASLTEAFTALAKQFEEYHDGVDVQLELGPSSGLAEQISSGAPADVFAAASQGPMADLSSAGAVGTPVDFAVNRMEIAVPPDNPAGIRSLADLARQGVKVALCQDQVPCGEVAATVFDNAGLTVRPATEEADVKAVLTKVRLGEVDAGMVYVTDVQAAGDDVTGVEVPAADNASTTYPIATVRDGKQAALARQFVDLVGSRAGQAELRKSGFEAAP